MSRIVHFTDNEIAGFQLSTRVMNTLQDELQDLIKAFICVVGNNTIVCGVTGPIGGSIYSDGLIIFNNEFLYFEGGPYGQYIVINEEITELRFCDGEDYKAYTVRTARFQNSVTPEDIYIEVDNEEGLGNGFTPIVDITTMNNNFNTSITNLQNQITNLTTIVNENSLSDNAEIGDIKYLKNISNFNGSGLGLVGTNREGWALVSTGNNEWKTALGFGGTFNDIDGRVVAIAGNKYSVLDQFGSDDVLLTGSQSGTPNHTHTGSTSSAGSHTHTANIARKGESPGPGYGFKQGDNIGSGGIPDGEGSEIFPAGNHTHSLSIDPTGDIPASEAHENRQPTIALYMAVKYAI